MDMKQKYALKKLVFALIFLAMFSAGCQNGGGGSGSSDSGFDPFNFGDETAEAGKLVSEANEELKAIRQIQKENRGKGDDLRDAVDEKNLEDVKKISDDLISAINEGLIHAGNAIAKLDEAANKKTNEKFKEYLRLKSEVLQKQKDAFIARRDAAKVLRDQLVTDDKSKIEKAIADFKRKEESFQELMQVADEINEQANKIAKDNPRQIKTK
jgi:hydrogenase maturation factor